MAKKGVKLLVPGEKERVVVSLSKEEKESVSGLVAEQEEEEMEEEKKKGEEELTATATTGEICEVRRVVVSEMG